MGRFIKSQDTNRNSYTNGQLILERWIRELGFITELEKEFPPYCADIYLQEIHVVIEYDGAQHWKKKDKKKDDFLIKNYYLPVLRIKTLSPKEVIVQKIRSFIEENIETKPDRKWKYEKKTF